MFIEGSFYRQCPTSVATLRAFRSEVPPAHIQRPPVIFAPIKLHAVKAIHQRNLAAYWLDLASRGTLPSFEDFKPSDRLHDPKRMLVWTVGGTETAPTFSPTQAGQYFVEGFGEKPDLGIDISEVLRRLIFTGLTECATTRAIIYMTIVSLDSGSNQIDCERLLIPFCNGDGMVTHILSSVELISLTGTFERRSVLKHFSAHSRVSFCGKIVSEPLVIST